MIIYAGDTSAGSDHVGKQYIAVDLYYLCEYSPLCNRAPADNGSCWSCGGYHSELYRAGYLTWSPSTSSIYDCAKDRHPSADRTNRLDEVGQMLPVPDGGQGAFVHNSTLQRDGHLHLLDMAQGAFLCIV